MNAIVPIISISIAPFKGFSPVILLFEAPARNNIPKDTRDDNIKEPNPKFKKYGNRGMNEPNTNAINVKIAPIAGLSGSSNPNSLLMRKSSQTCLLEVMVSTHESRFTP